MLDLTEILFVF